MKDTLDPANFANINAGGGYTAQAFGSIDLVDGRTHFGFLPEQRGRLASLTFRFVVFGLGNQPISEPARQDLFDLSVALYASLIEAEASPTRVDAFFSQTTQAQDLFDHPTGSTAAAGGVNAAEVFEAAFDLTELSLAVHPCSINYLGISTTGVPAGVGFQPQRSDDSGVVVGSEPDYLSGSIFGSGLLPMSDFYSDAIQNSVRITITNFGDARDGDFNGDGVVDAADYTVWRDNLGATSGPGLIADGNVDGAVDEGDYATWRQWYGQTVPGAANAAATAVPESAANIIAIGVVVAAVFCRIGRQNRCSGRRQEPSFGDE